ncbi:SulP family inorganic anion transporter [Parenemella sanctibonifatiensis]|uniref:SulP family inorganic anion transporter n=1 Tax=Parenemella sanctibonifatiensis TaxID=2016505 RepID=UPI003982DCAC
MGTGCRGSRRRIHDGGAADPPAGARLADRDRLSFRCWRCSCRARWQPSAPSLPRCPRPRSRCSNVRAGARTRLSAVVHAGVLLAVVYAAAQPVGSIPLAALAGVLFLTAVRMVHTPPYARSCAPPVRML